MILNDEEIKDLGPREIIPGVDDYILILKDSHIEANAELCKANARIRELEDENRCLEMQIRPRSRRRTSKTTFPSSQGGRKR